MDLQPNKVDGIIKPITNTRISATEWNQIAGSLMEFITQAGLTPDANDNEQLLDAFKAIAADLSLIGANTNLSNLTATGESHFANPSLSNISNLGKQEIVNYAMPDYANGTTETLPAHGTWTQVTKDSFVVVSGTDPYGVNVTAWVSAENTGNNTHIVGSFYNDETSGFTKGCSFSFFVPKNWYFKTDFEQSHYAYIYPLKGAQ